MNNWCIRLFWISSEAKFNEKLCRIISGIVFFIKKAHYSNKKRNRNWISDSLKVMILTLAALPSDCISFCLSFRVEFQYLTTLNLRKLLYIFRFILDNDFPYESRTPKINTNKAIETLNQLWSGMNQLEAKPSTV